MHPAHAAEDICLKSSSTHPEFNVVGAILVPEDLWKGGWVKALRAPVARATFVAAAMETGIWHPVKLEEHGLKRIGSLHDASRHLRRLRNGERARKTGVVILDKDIGAGGRVAYWANHPVFHLLNLKWRSPRFDQVLFYALNSLTGRMRYHFWSGSMTTEQPGSADYATAVLPDPTMLRTALSNRRDAADLAELDWLVLSLATYTHATRARHKELAWEAAAITSSAFSRAVLLHPPLLVSWRELADSFAEKVWDPAGLEGIFRADLLRIPKDVEFLTRRGVLDLPPEAMVLAGLQPDTSSELS